MSDKFTNDLTQGSVAKQLIKFSWPFLLSMFIQSVYGLADLMIVGWFMGPNGINAVQNSSQITLVVTNVIVGFSIGGTVLIAQYLGAKMMEEVKESIGTLFTVFLIAAATVTVVMLIFGASCLRLLNTPDISFSDALDYLNICMAGTVFIVGYNAVSAVLRALGDSKRPLWFVIIAAVINIVLDLLLVGVFNMRAAGAALATVIAQAVSFILSVIYLKMNNFIFDFKLRSFKIHADKLKKLVKVGLPTMAQQTLVSFSFLALTSLANAVGGIAGGTAIGIGGKVNGFAILPGIAMSSSIASMSGQNIGAGDYKRAKKTLWVGMGITVVIAAAVFALMQIFPELIVDAFIGTAGDYTEQQMIDIVGTSVMYLRLLCFDSLIVSVGFCFNGLINGSGKTVITMISSFVSSIGIRVPLAYILALGCNLGMLGIGIAAAVSPISTVLIGSIYYKSGIWAKKRII